MNDISRSDNNTALSTGNEMTLADRLRLALEASQDDQAQAQDAANGYIAAQKAGTDKLLGLASFARSHAPTQALLAALNDARNRVLNDAIGFHEYTKGRLVELAQEDAPDPEQAIALLHDLVRTTLANDTPASPVFRLEADFAKARQWFGGSVPLVLPTFSEEKGYIRATGPRAVVPVRGEYSRLLVLLQQLLVKAARVMNARLENEYLANVDFTQGIAKQAAVLLQAQFASKRDFHRRYQPIEGTKPTLFERIDGSPNPKQRQIAGTAPNSAPPAKPKGKGRYRRVRISQYESLMVPTGPEGDVFAEEMDRITKSSIAFFKNRLEAAATIHNICKIAQDDGVKVLSIDEFRAGESGLLIVSHTEWRKRGGDGAEEPLLVLFQRRMDGAWRWVFCNPAAARVLFSGWQMRYHAWSHEQLPAHLDALLRTGGWITLQSLAEFVKQQGLFDGDAGEEGSEQALDAE